MSATRWIASLVVLVLVGCGPNARSASESAGATGIGGQGAGQPSVLNSDTWAVMGVGVNDCATMTAELAGDTVPQEDQRTAKLVKKYVYMHYAAGFVTGSNFISAQTRRGNSHVRTSDEALLAAMVQYCGQHPLDKVATALTDVYRQLYEQ